MAKKQQKNNSIRAWLEKILAKTKTGNIITGIGLIVTIVIGIPTLLHYFSDRPAQLTLEYISFYISGETAFSKPVDKNITHFVSVHEPFAKNVSFGDADHISFHNKCQKSVTNLKVTVVVLYDADLYLNLADINPDYEILRCDTSFIGDQDIFYQVTLRYKNDNLCAQGLLPLPIRTLSLQEEANDKAKLVAFNYNILYDGLKKPLLIKEYHLAYFASGLEQEQVLSRYLDECYYQYHYFTDNKSNVLVTIPTPKDVIFVNPPTLSSDEDYEKFKESFIEDFDGRIL